LIKAIANSIKRYAYSIIFRQGLSTNQLLLVTKNREPPRHKKRLQGTLTLGTF
jgi:hypothetical protein